VYLERYVHTPLRKYDASKLFCGMGSIPLLCIYFPCTGPWVWWGVMWRDESEKER